MLCVAFDPQKPNILASGSADETIIIWDIESGACQSTLRGDKQVNCVAFSPDGGTLAAGDGGWGSKYDSAPNVRLYDVQTGAVKSTLTGHSERVNCVVFSPNGKVIASCSGEGYMRDNSVRLWDASTGEPIGSPLTGHRYVPSPCIECLLL